ncbi:MAG: hypothetical protein HFF15_07710 [Angelakisella sp.]|jgi:hypothetical protein|nr:hypothetical protein [Angelakisella sp.]
MKRMKRLLSVLLTAALVGQMGVVVGMGAAGCNSATHGQTGGRVESAGSCDFGVHWLAGAAMTGGSGKSFYYPDQTAPQILLPGGKGNEHTIILPATLSAGTSLNITVNGSQDVSSVTVFAPAGLIYVENTGEFMDADGNTTVVLENETAASVAVKTFPSEKPSFTLEQKNGSVIATGKGNYFYLWQKRDEKGNVTALNDHGSQIPAETAIGSWTYICTAVDEAGQTTGPVETTVSVTGCESKAVLGPITGVAVGARFSEDTAKTLSCLPAVTEGACNLTTHSPAAGHGYSVAWTGNWKDVPGVSFDNGQLTITAKDLPEAEATVTITATLTQDGKAVTPGQTQSVSFTVQKPPAESSSSSSDTTSNPDSSSGNSSSDTTSKPDSSSGSSSSDTTSNPDSSSGSSSSDTTSKPDSSSGNSSSDTTSNPDSSSGSSSSDTTSNPDSSSGSSSSDTTSKPDSSSGNSSSDTTSKPDSSSGSSSSDTTSKPDSSSGNSSSDTTSKPDSSSSADQPVCHAEPQAVAISGGQDRIDEKTGSSIHYTATADFGLVPDCTLAEHTSGVGKAHDYTVTWSLAGGGDFARVDSAGNVIINPEKLPLSETKLTLTATLSKAGDVARGGVRTAAKEIIAARSDVCNYKGTVQVTAPQDYITFTSEDEKKGLWEKSETLSAAVTTTSQDCGVTPAHDHKKLLWQVDSPCAVLSAQETDLNGSVKVTVDYRKVPKMQSEVKVTATIKDTNISNTFTLRVNRPQMCQVLVEKVTVSGGNSLSVAANRLVQHTYTAARTYDKGICDMPGHSEKNGHGETISWRITKGAVAGITLDENGRLTVDGSKLSNGKSYDITITVTADSKSAEYPVKITCTAPLPESDSDDNDDREWEDLEDKIDDARRGDTVKLSLGDNVDVPFYIFDSLRGRDVTLQIKAGKGYTWTVNGKSVKKIPSYQIYIPLDIESYSNSKMEKLCRDSDVKSFRLRHKGSFYADMKLSVDLGQGRASKTMYLYSYDEDRNKLTYCSSAKADGYGEVSFVLTKSLGTYVITSKALYGESPVTSGGGAVGGGGITTIYPPTAPVSPAPVPPASSSSESSSSSSESSSEDSGVSIPPPPSQPSSVSAQPTDTPVEPEKDSFPVLVPVLILCIAGVITATALIVRGGRGKSEEEEG